MGGGRSSRLTTGDLSTGLGRVEGAGEAGSPLGISAAMFSTPLLTVRGRPCSVGVETQSSELATGW